MFDPHPNPLQHSIDGPAHAHGAGDATWEPAADWARASVRGENTTLRGAGVGVALIDTGVDAGHAAFADARLTCGPRFDGRGRVVQAACDDDPHGHGTRLASAIIGCRGGVAPDASLLVVGAVAPGGTAAAAGVVAALEYVAELGDIDVLALPLCPSAASPATDVDRVARAVGALVARGVLVAVATGNGGRAELEETASPWACVDGVLAVGGVFRPGVFYERSGRSARHGVPHVCAPCARVQVPVAAHAGVWEVWDGGTSYACALAAGAAACLIGGATDLRRNPRALVSTLCRLAVPLRHGPAGSRPTTIRLPRPSDGRRADATTSRRTSARPCQEHAA